MSKESRKKQASSNYKSPAQIIFKDAQIITARPEEMPYEEYKILQRIQSKVMKLLFRKGHSSSRNILIPRPHYPPRPAPTLTQYLQYLQTKTKDVEQEKT